MKELREKLKKTTKKYGSKEVEWDEFSNVEEMWGKMKLGLFVSAREGYGSVRWESMNGGVTRLNLL